MASTPPSDGVVYGAQVKFNLTDGSGTAISPAQFMEITRATYKYQPQTKTRWPAGSSKPKIRATGGHWEMMLEGGMVGSGFLPIIMAQKADIDAGRDPRRLSVTIGPLTMQHGVISSGGGGVTTGDVEATTDITVLFEDATMDWEQAPIFGL